MRIPTGVSKEWEHERTCHVCEVWSSPFVAKTQWIYKMWGESYAGARHPQRPHGCPLETGFQLWVKMETINSVYQWISRGGHFGGVESRGREISYKAISFFCFFFCCCFVFCLFAFSRAAPAAYRDSQARGLIGAVAAVLRHSHSSARSKPTEKGQGSNPQPHGS